MSERDQDGYFALVAFVLLALAAIALVYITLAISKGYQRADQEHEAYYAERAATEIRYRECLAAATTLQGARECIQNAPETPRESERAEQDLNAQRQMAQWAEGMLWASIFVGILTVGATILGVRYVYLTLVATRDMARETTRIGEAQVRAYLTNDGATIEPEIIEGDSLIQWRVRAKARNSGQSPARRVMMAVSGKYFATEVFKFQFGDIAAGGTADMVCLATSRENDLEWRTDTSIFIQAQIDFIFFDVFRPQGPPLVETELFAGVVEMVSGHSQRLYSVGTIPNKATPRD